MEWENLCGAVEKFENFEEDVIVGNQRQSEEKRMKATRVDR